MVPFHLLSYTCVTFLHLYLLHQVSGLLQDPLLNDILTQAKVTQRCQGEASLSLPYSTIAHKETLLREQRAKRATSKVLGEAKTIKTHWFTNLYLPCNSYHSLHCRVCPQSCQLASQWLPSPSCSHIQTLSCRHQDGCCTRRHTVELAVGNKCITAKSFNASCFPSASLMYLNSSHVKMSAGATDLIQHYQVKRSQEMTEFIM